MTIQQIVEKIKNLNGNKMNWCAFLTHEDSGIAESAFKKIDVINKDIKNLKQLSFEMVIYPENFKDYPETQHPSIEDIID